MPALPYNGTYDAALFNSRSVAVAPALVSNSVRVEGEGIYFGGSGRDDTVGNPTPSYKIARYGFINLRLAIPAGSRIVSVQVLQPDVTAARPYLQLNANADIGLNTAIVATAGLSTTWQTLSAVFTATQNGGVMIRLFNADLSKPCWFDNVSVQ